MHLRLALIALTASSVTSSGKQPHREKGRNNLRSNERYLDSYLSPYETTSSRGNRSKLARDDNGKRDAYIPVSKRDNTSFEHSETVDDLDVNVSVNVNVNVDTGTVPSPPPPPPPPTPAECLKWDISYVTEIENQMFKYQYYSSSSSKSGKSAGKSGKSAGKSGKDSGKSGKMMMKQVEVKREVKTCIETAPPLSTVSPTIGETERSTPSPNEQVSTSCSSIKIR